MTCWRERAGLPPCREYCWRAWACGKNKAACEPPRDDEQEEPEADDDETGTAAVVHSAC